MLRHKFACAYHQSHTKIVIYRFRSCRQRKDSRVSFKQRENKKARKTRKSEYRGFEQIRIAIFGNRGDKVVKFRDPLYERFN